MKIRFKDDIWVDGTDYKQGMIYDLPAWLGELVLANGSAEKVKTAYPDRPPRSLKTTTPKVGKPPTR